MINIILLPLIIIAYVLGFFITTLMLSVETKDSDEKAEGIIMNVFCVLWPGLWLFLFGYILYSSLRKILKRK